MRLALLFAALLSLTGLTFAWNPKVDVLVGTEVSAAAAGTMPPALWARLVGRWVGENAIPFNGNPTLEDCSRAKALYMVRAPFELKPRLPGTPLHVNNRIAAQSHVTVTNCATRQPVFDQVISLESNPVSASVLGEGESASATWEAPIRAAFHAHPIVFARHLRVAKISPPYVSIEGDTRGITIGQTLRVYAGADGVRRTPPVVLTVVALTGHQIQTKFDAADARNRVQVGDLVEPYAGAVPLK